MLIIRRPLQKEFASNNSLNTLNDIVRLQNPGLSKELLKILIMNTDGEDIYHWLSDMVINKYIKENISAENRNRFLIPPGILFINLEDKSSIVNIKTIGKLLKDFG